jgi:hypothetical protein
MNSYGFIFAFFLCFKNLKQNKSEFIQTYYNSFAICKPSTALALRYVWHWLAIAYTLAAQPTHRQKKDVMLFGNQNGPLNPQNFSSEWKKRERNILQQTTFLFSQKKKNLFFWKRKKKHFEPSLQASTTYSKKILKLLIKKVGPNSKEKSPHPVLVQNVRA